MNANEARAAASACDLEGLAELKAEELERESPRNSVLEYIEKRIKREKAKLTRPPVIGFSDCHVCGAEVTVKRNCNGVLYYFCQDCGCEHRVKTEPHITNFFKSLRKPEKEQEHGNGKETSAEDTGKEGSASTEKAGSRRRRGSGQGTPIGCL